MNEIGRAVNHFTMLRRLDSGEKKSLYDMAISALEKQIPKKALEVKISLQSHSSIIKSIYGKCPVCNTIQADDNYCQHCGQAIDWSVEE